MSQGIDRMITLSSLGGVMVVMLALVWQKGEGLHNVLGTIFPMLITLFILGAVELGILIVRDWNFSSSIN